MDYIYQVNFVTDIGLEIVCRVFFFIIQTIFVFLFEGNISFLQLRILVLVWLNSFLKACSVQVDPMQLFVILWITMGPLFNHMDGTIKENTVRKAN